MPTELQIIRAQEFIRLGAQGTVDLQASKAALAVLAAACWKRGISQALLDLREVHLGPKPVFSPKDLAALVNTFHEIGFTYKQRLAVLYRLDPHRRARMFAFIAILHGWNVQAFHSYEAALTWLSHVEHEPKEEETGSTHRAKRVPVHKLKPLKASAKPASQPSIEIKSIPTPGRDASELKNLKRQKITARFAKKVLSIALLLAVGRSAVVAQPASTETAATAGKAPSPFSPTIPNTNRPSMAAPEGMVWIPGGEYSMGCTVPDEGICTRATLAPRRTRSPSTGCTWTASGWTPTT
jgi:hypothetical protein